jgi:membrane associated rhomboid family serine protease
MGIYDREYYRRSGPSFLGSIATQGQVCKWLIGINVLLFVLQVISPPYQAKPPRDDDQEEFVGHDPRARQAADGDVVTHYLSLDVGGVLHGQVWRLVTYAFMHDTHSLWHIVFNMLFLWWFGKEVEDLYGSREFLAFYLVSAVLSGLAFVVAGLAGWTGGGRPPGLEWIPTCIGASGAVTAVMVLYALHYPTAVINIWFVFPIPIWVFVLFQVGKDLLTFLGGQPTGTAVSVHLGGAAFAFAYYKLHWRVLYLVPNLGQWRRQLTRPRLRVYREEQVSAETPVPVSGGPDVDEHLEAKVDAVLEKVARHGQASLTENERQILMRASEVYKKRRT